MLDIRTGLRDLFDSIVGKAFSPHFTGGNQRRLVLRRLAQYTERNKRPSGYDRFSSRPTNLGLERTITVCTHASQTRTYKPNGPRERARRARQLAHG